MAIETSVNKEWSIRLLIITVAFGFWGCWSLYDGLVGYPQQRELYRMTHTETDGTVQGVELTRAQWEDAKEALAAAGYNPDVIEARANKLKPRSRTDIWAQYAMAIICFPIAIAAFFWMLHHSRRKPRVDDRGLTFAGTTVPFDAIGQIDKELWDSKGIATIHYDLRGKPGRFKMDDWKYKGAVEALAFIEDKLGRSSGATESATEPDPTPETPANA